MELDCLEVKATNCSLRKDLRMLPKLLRSENDLPLSISCLQCSIRALAHRSPLLLGENSSCLRSLPSSSKPLSSLIAAKPHHSRTLLLHIPFPFLQFLVINSSLSSRWIQVFTPALKTLYHLVPIHISSLSPVTHSIHHSQPHRDFSTC